MGNRKLFLSREFCKGLCKRWIKEVRIVTEPARSPRLVYDRTIGATLEDRENLALPRERNGANVVGRGSRRGRSHTCPYTRSLNSSQFFQELPIVGRVGCVEASISRREDAGGTPQGVDAKARIIGKYQLGGKGAVVRGLLARVFLEGGTVLAAGRQPVESRDGLYADGPWEGGLLELAQFSRIG